MNFKIGESVKIKSNIVIKDFKKIDFTAWQGRIIECYAQDEIEVEWDSQTLKNLPEAYILKNIEEDYNFDSMILKAQQVEKTTARDEEKDRLSILQTLENKYNSLDDFGNDDTFYKDLFESKNIAVTPRNLNIYLEYIKECIEMPCLLKNIKHKENYQLFSFEEKDIEKHNTIGVKVIRTEDKKQLILPLHELIPLDEISENYSILKPYSDWFLKNK
jgi:hypothetical protein